MIDEGESLAFVEEMPELFQDLKEVYHIFLYLSRKRRCGFAPEAISPADIESTLNLYRIDDPEKRLDYLQYIDALDSKWLEWSREESAKKKEDE